MRGGRGDGRGGRGDGRGGRGDGRGGRGDGRGGRGDRRGGRGQVQGAARFSVSPVRDREQVSDHAGRRRGAVSVGSNLDVGERSKSDQSQLPNDEDLSKTQFRGEVLSESDK